MDKDIFALIDRNEEKSKLWKDLAQAQGEIICKGQEDVVCKLRVLSYNSKSESVECKFESKDVLKSQEEYLGHFYLGGEKYYFQSAALTQQDRITVPIPKELYRLQRRQNYRVRIPDGYGASYSITTFNGKPEKWASPIADLSSQGCRVNFKGSSPQIKIGDKLGGTLLIGKRPPLEVQGIVRHVKLTEGDSPNQTTQTLGIEFSPLPSILENKLFAMTMEIHKEIFRRPL